MNGIWTFCYFRVYSDSNLLRKMGKLACGVASVSYSKASSDDPFVHACADRSRLARLPPVVLPSASSPKSGKRGEPRIPSGEPVWLNDIPRPQATHLSLSVLGTLLGTSALADMARSNNTSQRPAGITSQGKPGSGAVTKISPSFGASASVRNGRPQANAVTKEAYDMTFKVMLVGDSGVGKSCLLIRFRDGAFLGGTFISTVGIDFRNKVVAVDGIKVKLQIWDTAGQERFRSVTHAYYRDAHALLLLYDVSNKTSFDNTRAWLGEINEYAQDDVVIMLIGNKADKSTERQVRYEDGERLAREYGVAFMETSAKTGMNVELAFMAVARDLKYRKTRNPDEPKFNVTEYVQQESEKTTSGCCS